MRPWVGVSMMMESAFLNAAHPLFSSEEVEMVEWSFDIIKEGNDSPEWLQELLKEYSKKARLVGHGVRYSILSGKWEARHDKWLNYLKKEVQKNSYRYFTEHFGFMSSGNFHKGAPLPVPMTNQTLLIGQDRLMRLQNVVQVPVGLENLAFAFSEDEIKQQGAFLEKLIEPVNGFIILDLHNVWCQAINFKVDVLKLVQSYPLDKIREIHISGGSWSVSEHSSDKLKVRRDTHDEAVPSELFELLPAVLDLCKNVECVVFERLGYTITSDAEADQFKEDFLRIKKIVANKKGKDDYPKEKLEKIFPQFNLPIKPVSDNKISDHQKKLIQILSENKNPFDVQKMLIADSDFNDWKVNEWTIPMIETAIQLIEKWGD